MSDTCRKVPLSPAALLFSGETGIASTSDRRTTSQAAARLPSVAATGGPGTSAAIAARTGGTAAAAIESVLGPQLTAQRTRIGLVAGRISDDAAAPADLRPLLPAQGTPEALKIAPCPARVQRSEGPSGLDRRGRPLGGGRRGRRERQYRHHAEDVFHDASLLAAGASRLIICRRNNCSDF